jgi:soluble lytic murein transglycosylase-like protein
MRQQSVKGCRTVIGGVGVALLTAPAAQGGDAAVGARPPARQAEHLVAQALAYEHGEGVPRDPIRAAALYCQAVRLGDAKAMYALGWMYANARGVDRNDAYAGTLFAMAAFLGNEHAARMMRYTGEYTGALPDCLRASGPRLPYAQSPEKLIDGMAPARQQIARMLVSLAPEYGVQPKFALAIALTESNLDPQALSPKSAMGVMQLIPETAERFNVTQPYDPEQNIRGGLAYLRWLLAYFEGDIMLAAAGYNAGEGAVNRHGGVPPYRETRAYVERILAFVGQRLHPFDAEVTEPSPALRRLRAAGDGEQGS